MDRGRVFATARRWAPLVVKPVKDCRRLLCKAKDSYPGRGQPVRAVSFRRGRKSSWGTEGCRNCFGILGGLGPLVRRLLSSTPSPGFSLWWKGGGARHRQRALHVRPRRTGLIRQPALGSRTHGTTASGRPGRISLSIDDGRPRSTAVPAGILARISSQVCGAPQAGGCGVFPLPCRALNSLSRRRATRRGRCRYGRADESR
jgi:hypothetical protein